MRLIKKILKDKFLEVFDEHGNRKGFASRAKCHCNKSLIHRVVHLLILNSKGELYLQKRAQNKDIQPGKWDISVGGHINIGEDPEEALKREAEEELGIKNFQYKFCYSYLNRSDVETELVYTYSCIYNDKIIINPKEISEGRFWDIDKIKKRLGTGIFTPNFENEFRNLIRTEFLKNAKN